MIGRFMTRNYSGSQTRDMTTNIREGQREIGGNGKEINSGGKEQWK